MNTSDSSLFYRPALSAYPYSDAQHLQLLLEIEPFVLTRGQKFYNHVVKRALDCFLAALGLLLLSPVLLLVALLILKESGSPVFFKQKRMGQGGVPFSILKFRSMYQAAPSNLSTAELKNSSSHITPLGELLRKTSLDELPQLLNVLKGEMALVGPRPLISREQDMDYLRKENGVYQLKPGITGLAQVKGRDFVDVTDKIRYDKEYLKTLSFWKDFKILTKTFLSVFKKDSIAH